MRARVCSEDRRQDRRGRSGDTSRRYRSARRRWCNWRRMGIRSRWCMAAAARLTRTLKLMGKESEFVHGLRVTDAETRDVALMVLAGIVNKSLVAAIAAAGQPAIGLCGGDGGVFRARKKQDAEHDLGFVGEICFSEPRWIKAIWTEGGIPGAVVGRARRRRRILQRERGSDGGGVRDRLPGRRADFSDRRGWSEAGGRLGDGASEYEGCCRTD